MPTWSRWTSSAPATAPWSSPTTPARPHHRRRPGPPRRAPWRVADLTLDEVLRLDAGSWFSPAYAGTRVATLEQALDLLAGTGTGLLLEVKRPALHPGIAADVAAALRSHPLERVVVQSFDHEVMRDSRPGARGAGRPARPPAGAPAPRPRGVDESGQPASSPDDAGVRRRGARRGLDCLVWTVDQLADIRRVLDLGVDGVISNRPDVVRRALADRLVPV